MILGKFQILVKLYYNFISPFYMLFQNMIYNTFIAPYTTKLYRNYLKNELDFKYILDIGVGNGKALLSGKDIIKRKNIQIKGIDINPDVIKVAKKRIIENNMQDNIDVECANIYNWNKNKIQKFDTILFSDCWALIPNVEEMAEYCLYNFLKSMKSRTSDKNKYSCRGKLVILQTLDSEKNQLRSALKSNIGKFIGNVNDFGRCVYFSEMEEFIKKLKSEFTVSNSHIDLVLKSSLFV